MSFVAIQKESKDENPPRRRDVGIKALPDTRIGDIYVIIIC